MTSDWNKYVGAELYWSLGNAMNQWQHVEIGVFHVFRRVTQIPNDLIASAVFFSPIGFRDKLAMVNSSAAYALAGSPHEARWITLSNKVGEKNKRRNQLAHFMSLHTGNSDDLQSHLRPNLFDAKAALQWHKEGRMPQYSPQQLRDIGTSFGRLSQKLENFATELADLKLPSPGKSPLQEDDHASATENTAHPDPNLPGALPSPSRKIP